MSPSFAALAIVILGQHGYKPNEIKFRVPIYEVNQVIHAHAVSQGAVLDWASYEEDGELMARFESIKQAWKEKAHDRFNG